MTEEAHLRCIIVDPQARTIVEDQCPIVKNDASYDWMKDKLGGGWLETTPRYFDGKQAVVILDEEGRLKNLQPFVMMTDQGPEDFCGVTMFFGEVKGGGAIGGLNAKITFESMQNRVRWLPMGQNAPDPGFKIIMDIEMEYLCKIVVDSKFHVAVWNGTMFQINPALIDPKDKTKYNPGPVSYFTVKPVEVGLSAASMDPVFHPKVFSPALWLNARGSMDKVKAVVAAKIGKKPEELIEVPMSAGGAMPTVADSEQEE